MVYKKSKFFALLALGCAAFSAPAAASSGDTKPLKQIPWQFDGVLGTFDRQSIQRGYQIYKEVCASCHSLKQVAYRNLQDAGFSEAEVKAIAAEYSVTDGPNDDGDMFERPAKPSDKFVSPFANEKAARASNGGAYPPDLSLITKARHDGPNYVYSLLTGYSEPPAHMEMMPGMNYNPYFPGGQIAMAAPLSEGLVTYQDGTPASLDQQARDIVNFLQWAAEPEMEHRKGMGLRVMIFLALFTLVFILAKKRVWKKVGKH